MTEVEETWEKRSDQDVVEAAQRLGNYTDEGQRVIRAELRRRGLREPAAAPPAPAVGEEKGGQAIATARTRHGCLEAFLLLTVLGNAWVALLYFSGKAVSGEALPEDVGGGVRAILVAGSLFNMACAVALHNWRKWGFWGFCCSGAVATAVNTYLDPRLGFVSGISALLAVLSLYGLLNLGKEKKAWPQLQ